MGGLIDFEKLAAIGGGHSGKYVWDSDREKDGRLTPKRLLALVEWLGLLPQGIRV